jgi:hypothetical protein
MPEVNGKSEVIECFTKKCPHLTTESAQLLFDRLQLKCPFWIHKVIEVRSALLKPFGFSEIKWENFTCVEKTEDRLHLSFQDKFFSSNIILQINRQSQDVTLTNSLRFNRKGGYLYFMLTEPIHKRILKELMELI